MKSTIWGLLLIAAFTGPIQVQAAVIASVDRATFQAAVAGNAITQQDFDSIAVGTVLGTLGGVTYGASGGSPIVTSTFLTSTGLNGLGSTSVGFFLPSETATFSFATPISAFAIDVNTFANTNGAYQAVLDTGDVISSLFEVFPGVGTGQFIGFASSTAFTSVTVSAQTDFSYTLDTLVFGAAAAVIPGTTVPEPHGLLLLALGLILLPLARGRRAT